MQVVDAELARVKRAREGKALRFDQALSAPPSGGEFPEWDIKTKLRYEREVLGRYVSGDPLLHVRGTAAHSLRAIADNPHQAPEWAEILGLCLEVEHLTSRKGASWVKFVVEDRSGFACESRAFGAVAGLVGAGHVARMRCRVEFEGETPSLVVSKYNLVSEW